MRAGDHDGLGTITLQTTLRLVTRELYVRRLGLPMPMRDPRVLRTLIVLDLESHPPPAGIDADGDRLSRWPAASSSRRCWRARIRDPRRSRR